MFRLFALLWLCLLQSARPEFIPLSMVLEARSDVIQYYPCKSLFVLVYV